jgi:hypothetical protein
MPETYYLVASPTTGLVVKRAKTSTLTLVDQLLCVLVVAKGVWREYRAGDQVDAEDLGGLSLDAWVEATRWTRRDRKGS